MSSALICGRMDVHLIINAFIFVYMNHMLKKEVFLDNMVQLAKGNSSISLDICVDGFLGEMVSILKCSSNHNRVDMSTSLQLLNFALGEFNFLFLFLIFFKIRFFYNLLFMIILFWGWEIVAPLESIQDHT